MQCPPTIGNCKLFRIKHITRLESETFLRNKHDIAFFEIKCTFFGRKVFSFEYVYEDKFEFKNQRRKPTILATPLLVTN